jgi:acetylornithine deacetylase/succinyl-diaminopimelate desuccinylase family protein
MTTKFLSREDKDTLVWWVRQLVNIPSTAVASDTSEPPEAKICHYLASYLRAIGMTVEILTTPEGRPNLLAHWPGENRKAAKKHLVLTTHMDTVNVEGMAIDPFAAEVKDGRIYGRGACDTKGSMAVFLWMLGQLKGQADAGPYQISFLATCDEENFCRGSRWLVESGFKADQIIVGEPTGSQIAPLHRGAMILELETFGKSAHASVPDRGLNAIDHMLDLLNAVRNEWMPSVTAEQHELLGSATAAITMIQGGTQPNIIPDRCQAVIDARILPSQQPREIETCLQKLLERHAEQRCIRFELRCRTAQPALATDPQGPLVQRLLNARRDLGLEARIVGLPYLTDAGNLARSGAECVVFGPGSIEQAHSADEYLEVEQLFLAAKILRQFFTS